MQNPIPWIIQLGTHPLATSRATITTTVHGSRNADRLVRYFRGRRTLGVSTDGTGQVPTDVDSFFLLCIVYFLHGMGDI